MIRWLSFYIAAVCIIVLMSCHQQNTGVPTGLIATIANSEILTANTYKANQNYMTQKDEALNIFGEKLESCCTDPMTGYFRDGYCNTSADDYGTHVICAVMTKEFLDYTLKLGNDLCTAKPEYHFPGLKPGDGWCLCAIRWKEAYDAGVAPLVRLESTHINALKFVKMEELVKYAVKDQDRK